MQHPDYPDIEFKPAIARYDWHQTYDVMEFYSLPAGFWRLMSELCIPVFELLALDRFTPYEYPWAENYSDFLYEKIKPYNYSSNSNIDSHTLQDGLRRFITENYFLNASASNPSYSASQLNFNVLKYNKNTNYFINLPQGIYAISFLIYQGFQEGFIGGINTVNQAFMIINHIGGEIDLNKIINSKVRDNYPFQAQSFINGEWQNVPWRNAEWINYNSDSQFCANSIVISQFNEQLKQWNKINVSGQPFLFYDNINSYFNQVFSAIDTYFADLVTQYESKGYVPPQSYLKSFELNYQVEKKVFPEADFFFNRVRWNISQDDVRDTITYTHEKLPNYYTDLCCLFRANNNKWNNVNTLFNDLGNTDCYRKIRNPNTLIEGQNPPSVPNNVTSAQVINDRLWEQATSEDYKVSIRFHNTDAMNEFDSSLLTTGVRYRARGMGSQNERDWFVIRGYFNIRNGNTRDYASFQRYDLPWQSSWTSGYPRDGSLSNFSLFGLWTLERWLDIEPEGTLPQWIPTNRQLQPDGTLLLFPPNPVKYLKHTFIYPYHFGYNRGDSIRVRQALIAKTEVANGYTNYLPSLDELQGLEILGVDYEVGVSLTFNGEGGVIDGSRIGTTDIEYSETYGIKCETEVFTESELNDLYNSPLNEPYDSEQNFINFLLEEKEKRHG